MSHLILEPDLGYEWEIAGFKHRSTSSLPLSLRDARPLVGEEHGNSRLAEVLGTPLSKSKFANEVSTSRSKIEVENRGVQIEPAGHGGLTTNYLLLTAYFLLLTANYLLLTTYYIEVCKSTLQSMAALGCGLSTVATATSRCHRESYLLLTTCNLLLTTYYLLLTVYYSLHTTYY